MKGFKKCISCSGIGFHEPNCSSFVSEEPKQRCACYHEYHRECTDACICSQEEPKQKACTCKVIEICPDGTRVIELNHLSCPRHRIKSLEKEGNDFMKQERVAAAEEKTCDCVIGEGWGAIDSNCPKHGFKYKSIPNLEPAPSLNTWEGDIIKNTFSIFKTYYEHGHPKSWVESQMLNQLEHYKQYVVSLAVQKKEEEPNPSLKTWEKSNPSISTDMEWEEDFRKFYVSLIENKSIKIRPSAVIRIKQFIASQITLAIQKERKKFNVNVGELRQWLNEDRITNPKKMVTNEQIKVFLAIVNKGVEEK